ncbi:hypothetical protein F4780DRAFT_760199 [Xylariomycetidae sp. FL0641]|nr:hypothetical protein F4780DRAFT_760199 [Xylariomycetidae sp. FL0641]
MARGAGLPIICARCALRQAVRTTPARPRRQQYSTKSSETDATPRAQQESKKANAGQEPESEPGPMARRLEEATEEALLTGGKAGRRAVEDAGFSEELKERLFAKVKDARFRSDHASAFAEAGMPSTAGQGTRLSATSQPWTGEENTEDAVLRMLNDAHKPLKPELRSRPNLPNLQPIDMRLKPAPRMSAGQRAASAKDKASMYAGMGMKEIDKGLTDEEKEAMRQELRDRFQPAARALPNTLSGLASLANERIEDAIARGQFKNIPRGTAVKRDTRSDNPFVDTTEYIMNKMIQRQEIVPPWIEKQQEVAKAVNVFRARLRNDWTRHAARMIASKGGSLEDQVARAQRYAQAEQKYNPRKRNMDSVAIPSNSTDDAVMVKIRQPASVQSEEIEPVAATVQETDKPDEPLPPPFRDPDWLAFERSYMDLAIANLNTLTRSYNLMAPELAKKPYYSLERELKNCYADVAPLIPKAIRDRATRPAKSLVDSAGDQPGHILDRFGGGGQRAKVYESKAPHYGFREMWRDFWSRS